MLAAALAFGALHLAQRVRAGGAARVAAAAGLLAGLATGVRYQNLALAVLAGGALVLSAHGRRARVGAAFAIGLAVPLVVCAAINARRLASWNPVSKGPAYFAALAPDGARGSLPVEALVATYARLVDHSPRPVPDPRNEQAAWLDREPETGSFVIAGALKKALLQSAPWALLPLLGMALAWRRSAPASARRTEVRAASLVVGGVLGLFALYGFRRHDGLCFNERYLLELVPLLAVIFAWALDDVELGARGLLLGALVAGGALGLVLALHPPLAVRARLLAWPPLVLAATTALVWALQPRRAATLGLLAGACLGWAVAAHLGDDLRASRRLRHANAERLAMVRAAVPAGERAAIFAYWGYKDALGPLLLERDLVIADPWIDDGADAPRLLRSFRAQGRTVYFLNGLVPTIGKADLAGLRLELVHAGEDRLVRAAPAPQP
jgi:hypothetical protein